VQSIFKGGPPRNRGDRWIKSSSYVLASAVVIALVWQFTTEAVRFSQGDPLLRPAQDNEAQRNSPAGNAADGNATGPENSITQVPAKSHLRASIASLNSGADQGSADRPLVAEGAWAAIGNRDLTVTDQPPEVVAGPVALAIVTSADSWVEIIDGSGAKIEMDLLRAGSRRDYNGTGPFRMLLGRASSVEVFHNGEKVDLAPYTRGNVARLTLGAPEDESVTEPEVTPQPEDPAVEATAPEQG
jgi:cytoskeleton protein RodZ